VQYLLLFGTTGLIALGQVLFKLSAGHDPGHPWAFLFSPIFIAAVAIYGLATLTWIFALRQFPISVAYPMQALAIVVVLVVGVLVFRESLSVMQWVGIGAIVAGMLALTLG
jgi:multidrug transporter EmrE-like cation transporter